MKENSTNNNGFEAKLKKVSTFFAPPSSEEMEKINRQHFNDLSKNKNMFSYWFSKIKDCGFDIPETIVIPLIYDQFSWLTSDNYTEEAKNKFSDEIIHYLKDHQFATNRTLFVKTGLFSGKFDFNNTCKVTDINKIGHHILNMYYMGMLFGCDDANEIVVREFIESNPELKRIYNGMPLNTEYRAFYDFDQRKVIGMFNYWDTETLLKSLHDKDKEIFMSETVRIEKEFEEHKDMVSQKINEHLENVELTGQWSVDIMLSNNKIYLTDMGLAQNSYYYEKIHL